MGKVFIISDLHFSHKNMAIKRGFKDDYKYDINRNTDWKRITTLRLCLVPKIQD